MTPILYRYTSDNAETWKEDAERYAESIRERADRGKILTEPFKRVISQWKFVNEKPVCKIAMFRDRNGFQCVVDASEPKPKE